MAGQDPGSVHLPRCSVLNVTVLKGRNLLAKDPNGKSDPYCILTIDGIGTEFQTKICPATLEPEWDQTFKFFVAPPAGVALGHDEEALIGGYLKVDVWDHDTFNAEDFLGRTLIPLSLLSEEVTEGWFPLGRGSPKEERMGEIKLKLHFSFKQDKIVKVSPPSSPNVSIISEDCSLSSDELKMNSRKDQATKINAELYNMTKKLTFHLQINTGSGVAEIPGPMEKAELIISDAIIQVGSAKCIAQVILTNYRLIILAQRGRKNWLRYEDTQDLTTYVPLNAIKSVEKNTDDKLIQRVSPQGAKNSDVVSIIIHCFDVRQIKLIFIHGTRSLLPQGVSGRDQFYAAKHTTKRDVFEGLIDEDSDGESDFIILSMTSSKSIPKKATDIDNTDKEDVTPNGQTSKAHDGHVTEKPSSFQKRAFSASDLEGYNERSLEENYEVADSTHVNPRRTVNDPLSFSSRKKVPSEKKDLELAMAYLKVRYLERATDALYNTRVNKVLLKPGSKGSKHTSVHQKLASALYLRLDHHLVNLDFEAPAWHFSKDNPNVQLLGWDLYNYANEMRRAGIHDSWQLSAINGPSYNLCSTYPALLYFPALLSEDSVKASADFRSKGRLPVVVWQKKRGNFMLRSAQPLTGTNYKRSSHDEELMRCALQTAPPDTECVIFDARSFIAAGGNRFKGKGTENPQNYSTSSNLCRLVYLDIPNIHVVRESMDKLCDVCLSGENDKWLSLVESTGWLNYISLILKGSSLVTRYMDQRHCCTLIHCSDGWDRTSQLCALAQLMMDPFYRTINGFIILIEKDWISFGHKFQHRLGHPAHPNERSPIFFQFLDCVYQILVQHENEFEFNSKLLLRIADHLNSGWFGTFMCNSEKERNDYALMANTASLWSHIQAATDEFVNPSYQPDSKQEVIYVEHSIRRLRLWQEYFLRYDDTLLLTLQGVEVEDAVEQIDASKVSSLSCTKDVVVWASDNKTTECKGCRQKFNILRRKHHCRACGQIFCNDCSKHRIQLPQFGHDGEVRVCDECLPKLSDSTDD